MDALAGSRRRRRTRARMPSSAAERRGDEMPEWVADKQARLAAGSARPRRRSKPRPARPRTPSARRRAAASRRATGAEAKRRPGRRATRRSATSPIPRAAIMKSDDGFMQGYNAQAAVDGTHQVIVAQHVTTNASDVHELVPLLDALKAHLGRGPREVSADAGYCSDSNLQALRRRRIRGYVATGRQTHGQPTATRAPGGSPAVEAMRRRLQRPDIAAATACASRSWSRCSASSNRRAASVSSSCGACPRSPVSSAWSARLIICSSSPRPAHDQGTCAPCVLATLPRLVSSPQPGHMILRVVFRLEPLPISRFPFTGTGS